jgi:hypothetical protein
MTFENPFSTRPLRIPTLSSAYPAKEVWEERTSPLGSKDRGSCQLLTTVAPSLRLRSSGIVAETLAVRTRVHTGLNPTRMRPPISRPGGA